MFSTDDAMSRWRSQTVPGHRSGKRKGSISLCLKAMFAGVGVAFLVVCCLGLMHRINPMSTLAEQNKVVCESQGGQLWRVDPPICIHREGGYIHMPVP